MKKEIKKLLAVAAMCCIGITSISGCGNSSQPDSSSEVSTQASSDDTQNTTEANDNKSKNAKSLDDYKSAGKIIMGTNAEFKPFEYHEGGKVTGFDVELSQMIADKLGVELAIEDMSFDGLISALETGKIDFVAAGMTVTPDKQKSVEFSNGYYNSTQSIIVMKSNTEIKGKDDLTNKKIGTQIATTGATEAKKIDGAEVIEYNSGPLAVMDLKNGKVDAVVLDLEPSKALAEQNDDITVLEEELTKEEYAIAARKGETELVGIINEVISEMQSNGKYEELLNKYDLNN